MDIALSLVMLTVIALIGGAVFLFRKGLAPGDPDARARSGHGVQRGDLDCADQERQRAREHRTKRTCAVKSAADNRQLGTSTEQAVA